MYNVAKKLTTRLSKGIRSLLIIMLIGLRPLLGPAHCKFSVSCTEFAVIKLQEGPLFHALWEIFKRILRCNPFYNHFE
jgi:putative component of membrane protein insertase Oxa1/YidC/SpoIIIJ protein YidD